MSDQSDVPEGYNPRDFPPVAVTVDIVVFTIVNDALHVLLVERGVPPFLGSWALPGGFVKPHESLDAAATRELVEETGVSHEPGHLEQLATYGAPDRDPRMRVVTVAYWGILANLEPHGGGDAAYAGLVPVSKLDRGGIKLAFDHSAIVSDAIERARSKLEYTTLAAKFCPPEFTISQLRKVYETVWNERLDEGNFQRKVRSAPDFLLPLEELSEPGLDGGRPAQLFELGHAQLLQSPIRRAEKFKFPELAESPEPAATPSKPDEVEPDE